MRLRYMLIGVVLLLLPALVAAEVYRYTDERGVIHFTDNYIEIPENQRPKVEIINRLDETTPPEVKTETDRAIDTRPPAERVEGDRPNQEAGAQGPEAVAEGAKSQQQFESLIKAKTDLDKIYDALAIEKDTLEKEEKTLKTVESIRAYQNKVNLFNQRLVDYEKQRQAFQTQADAYNKAIAK
ncbi:MAG: DUF4124 domain-containing protein [Desulfobacterales bacterium]|nr:DUF4124 domain-containing protein [Desulfobacterales bacterium]